MTKRLTIQFLIIAFLVRGNYSLGLWGKREKTEETRGSYGAIDVQDNSMIFEDTSKHPFLPDNFFNGQLVPGSRCYIAKQALNDLCGQRTERDRMFLATLITNCHIEAAGRPPIEWHAEKGLRDASGDLVSFVLQFVPYLSEICDKTGNSWTLSLLQTYAASEDTFADSLRDLNNAAEEVKEANRQAEVLATEMDDLSIKLANQTTDVLNTTHLLNDAATSLASGQVDFVHTLQNEFTSSMDSFWNDTNAKHEALLANIQRTKRYLVTSQKVRSSRAAPQQKDRSKSDLIAMAFINFFLPNSLISTVIRFVYFVSVVGRGLGLNMTMKRISTFMLLMVNKVTSLMNILERFEYIGGRHNVIVSGFRTVIGLFSFLVVFKILETVLMSLGSIAQAVVFARDFALQSASSALLHNEQRGTTLLPASDHRPINVGAESRRSFNHESEGTEQVLQIEAHDPHVSSQLDGLTDNVLEVSTSIARILRALQEIDRKIERTEDLQAAGDSRMEGLESLMAQLQPNNTEEPLGKPSRLAKLQTPGKQAGCSRPKLAAARSTKAADPSVVRGEAVAASSIHGRGRSPTRETQTALLSGKQSRGEPAGTPVPRRSGSHYNLRTRTPKKTNP